MSINTCIHLPRSVRTTDLATVMNRLMGVPFEQGTHVEQSIRGPAKSRPYQANEPSSSSNPWLLKFQYGPHQHTKYRASEGQLGMGYFAFMDGAQQHHEWFITLEGSEDPTDDCDIVLMPGSHPLAVAVGTRLVQFFGGKLMPNDSEGTYTLEVGPEQARYTGRSTERFYDLQNALLATRPLHSEELRAAQALACHPHTNDSLIEFLMQSEAQVLRESMTPSEPTPPTPRRKRARM